MFFRGAFAGLRQRVLHLDLPISLGILLAYGGSVACAVTGHGDSYFDTVTVFVALMLVGRYLQRTAVQRNRDYLLANDGAEHLRVRRLHDGELQSVPVAEVAAGDRLLLAPGDLVPVRCRLEREAASFSLDWINGESMPREFRRDQSVPAGAFVASRRAIEVRASADAHESGLLRLLAAPVQAAGELRGRERFWVWLNRGYVAAVLVVAALAGAVWLALDPSRALEITTAVLVVTCPCALGLATPLAFEMATARLRRQGIYVRTAELLEKARHVRKVVFDKTGTLTWGRPRARVLRAVRERSRDVLFTMVEGSNHPVSRGIASALQPANPRFLPDLRVDEVPGNGLRAVHDGVEYRLGAAAFVFAGSGPDSFNGQLRHPLGETFRLRPRLGTKRHPCRRCNLFYPSARRISVVRLDLKLPGAVTGWRRQVIELEREAGRSFRRALRGELATTNEREPPPSGFHHTGELVVEVEDHGRIGAQTRSAFWIDLHLVLIGDEVTVRTRPPDLQAELAAAVDGAQPQHRSLAEQHAIAGVEVFVPQASLRNEVAGIRRR